MNILIVSYLPRGERSVTKKMLNYFLESIGKDHTITHQELSRVQPVFFSEAVIEKQIEYFYTPEKQASLGISRMNQYQYQVAAADIIIIAHPIWNWNIPAPIKAWVDAIAWVDDLVFHGATDDSLAKRIRFDKKYILSLNVSGILYAPDHFYMTAARGYIEAFFRNLGASNLKTVSLAGVDNIDDTTWEILMDRGKKEIKKIIKKWGI